jgi:hypothetical protein
MDVLGFPLAWRANSRRLAPPRDVRSNEPAILAGPPRDHMVGVTAARRSYRRDSESRRSFGNLGEQPLARCNPSVSSASQTWAPLQGAPARRSVVMPPLSRRAGSLSCFQAQEGGTWIIRRPRN